MKIHHEGFLERVKEALQVKDVPGVARVLGIDEDRIFKWNKGTIPKPEVLVQISEISGISIHWLLTGEGERSLCGSTLPPLETPPPPDPLLVAIEEKIRDIAERVAERAITDSLEKSLRAWQEANPDLAEILAERRKAREGDEQISVQNRPTIRRYAAQVRKTRQMRQARGGQTGD